MSVADLAVPGGIAPVLDAVTVDIDRLRATVAGVTVEAGSAAELAVKLSQALYEVLHTGRRSEEGGALPFHLRDREFEQALAERVPHETTVSEAVIAEAGEGTEILVVCGGPRVWVPRGRILTEPPFTPGQRVNVALSPLRPALSPGFFFVYGSAPSDMRGDILRVYLHLADPEQAPAVWHLVLSHLEEQQAEYRAKVLSSQLLYPRRDGLVVYLGARSRGLAADLAALVEGVPGMGTETSAFAHALGPGVATAWEPDDRRLVMRGMSFGQHRAGVLGQALVEAAAGQAPASAVLAARFAEANIDPCDLARNGTSPQAMTEGVRTRPPIPDSDTHLGRR
ncbi:T3SS effector HopA1 family protein [Nonomuraea sp. M3C6]|uniref:T3SS effector HopA1 family protein n=1 Tax=Nonomuraea marmarensis TaxID=3351344 RepID=A0ABW7AAI8_9ACTN